MANLYGYKTNLVIVPEATYGAELTAWTGASTFNSTTIEMESATELVQRLIRSGTISETSCENIAGKVSGSVTISGTLLPSLFEVLMQGLSLDTDRAFPINSDNVSQASTGYSYTIVRKYTTTLGDVASGCVLTNVEYSTDDNFVNFTATFDAQEVNRNVSLSAVTGTTPLLEACEQPFTLADVSYVCGTWAITPMSFTMSFTNELDEDKINYGTSLTKSACYISKTTGSLTIEGINQSNEVIKATGTELEFKLGLGEDITVEVNTVVESHSIPDAERGVYVKSYTAKIVKGVSAPQYLVTVS